jgi:hypothetical protein
MKAFPTAVDNGHSENQDGMNLRDYFAAKTIDSLFKYISCNYERDLDNDDFICVANDSYRMADAMMEARQKNDS